VPPVEATPEALVSPHSNPARSTSASQPRAPCDCEPGAPRWPAPAPCDVAGDGSMRSLRSCATAITTATAIQILTAAKTTGRIASPWGDCLAGATLSRFNPNPSLCQSAVSVAYQVRITLQVLSCLPWTAKASKLGSSLGYLLRHFPTKTSRCELPHVSARWTMAGCWRRARLSKRATATKGSRTQLWRSGRPRSRVRRESSIMESTRSFCRT
jgi:hypothetical protein